MGRGYGGSVAHYQFSPKFIMKTLANLKFYPENSFNEVSHIHFFCLAGNEVLCMHFIPILKLVLYL